MEISDPRKAYRQTAIHSESMADIFMQLYDQLSSALHAAALAIEVGDIRKKTADVNRAFTILIHLQGVLDFERGGDVALNLNQFYRLVRKEISEGSAKLDAAQLRQAAAHVAELRNLWDQAQSVSLRQAASSGFGLPSLAAPNTSSDSASISHDENRRFHAWSA